MEFENFSSVKASSRRRTPVAIKCVDLGVHVLDARIRQHDRGGV